MTDPAQFENLVYEAIGPAEPVAFRFQSPAFAMDGSAAPATVVAPDRLSPGQSADLAVSATVDPEKPAGPGRITYHVTVRNGSDTTAEGVGLRVGVPESLVIADATLVKARRAGSTPVLDLCTLGGGDAAEVAVETNLPGVDEARRFVIDAPVFAKTHDHDPDNGLAFAAVGVTR